MEKQEEFDFSDGKDRETNQPKERSQAELEQLLDMGKMNPYQTLSKATFIERLEEMDLDEKHKLAIRVGITPVNNNTQLTERLVDNFDDFISKSRMIQGATSNDIDPSSEEYKKIKHLL
jgi:hypothetical protein|tara:strand:- start:1237 stop:1593 length:357 start_codon:yes stop_codon:yes gene_type:complete